MEAYRRLCENAYLNQKDIPIATKKAKILIKSQRKLKMEKEEMTLESSNILEVTAPPEEGAPALEGSTALLEGVDNVIVTTPAPDAVFASWTRIAAWAGNVETVESPQEASGVRWCVVHGEVSLQTEGWVQLILRWANLGFWNTRESVHTLLATCLQLSTPGPGGQYVVPQMCS